MAESDRVVRLVHYMVRRPDRLGQLLYPPELPGDYQGYGFFCLPGHCECCLDDQYLFYVVIDDDLFAVALERDGNSTFVASVPRIGRFRFRAKTFRSPVLYAGDFPLAPDEHPVRQLAPLNRNAHEIAVHEHRFYFAGYSPKLGVSPLGEPTRYPPGGQLGG